MPVFKGVTVERAVPGYWEDMVGGFFYRRKVYLAGTDPVFLAFEGVRNQVHLWVNGNFVAFRAGFSTPFELEIPVDAQAGRSPFPPFSSLQSARLRKFT